MKSAILGYLSMMAIVGVLVGYQEYDKRYISSDLRRTLTAAVDVTASQADIESYIRTARLQVRTKKDAALLGMYEQFMILSQIAAGRDARYRLLQQRDSEDIRRGTPQEWDERGKQEKEAWDEARREEKEASELYKNVLKELGLRD